MEQLLNKLTEPRNRIWTHVLFWIIYLVFFSLLYGNIHNDHVRGVTQFLCTLPATMAATYFTLYLLIPKFLDAKRYAEFTLLFIFTAVVFGYFDRLVVHWLWVPVYLPDYPYDKYPLTDLGKAIQQTTNVYTIVFVAAAIKLVKRNYQSEKLARELSQEKLDAELKFLKAQIHPHFLFNTLNTLYALTLQNSPLSSEVVLRLSNLLDYMLYDCNVPQISLRKEIQQIQNMIELEKFRYGERLEVALTQSGNIGHQMLPPLLMLPFIENAFKHGASQDIEDAFINIDITIKGNALTLRVENSKAPSPETPITDTGYTKGIGLKMCNDGSISSLAHITIFRFLTKRICL
ncbi:MAG: sensor histidine kinase [Haliscomenobacter sp.]|nr:sensor histidine kinase [Haliscomenobacter sp.]